MANPHGVGWIVKYRDHVQERTHLAIPRAAPSRNKAAAPHKRAIGQRVAPSLCLQCADKENPKRDIGRTHSPTSLLAECSLETQGAKCCALD